MLYCFFLAGIKGPSWRTTKAHGQGLCGVHNASDGETAVEIHALVRSLEAVSALACGDAIGCGFLVDGALYGINQLHFL